MLFSESVSIGLLTSSNEADKEVREKLFFQKSRLGLNEKEIMFKKQNKEKERYYVESPKTLIFRWTVLDLPVFLSSKWRGL